MLLINLYHGGFRLEEDREGKGKKKKKRGLDRSVTP